jgi:serine/threonine protein kinase
VEEVRWFESKDEEPFLAFLRKMLQWRPKDRQTAKELLTDPWLNSE